MPVQHPQRGTHPESQARERVAIEHPVVGEPAGRRETRRLVEQTEHLRDYTAVGVGVDEQRRHSQSASSAATPTATDVRPGAPVGPHTATTRPPPATDPSSTSPGVVGAGSADSGSPTSYGASCGAELAASGEGVGDLLGRRRQS